MIEPRSAEEGLTAAETIPVDFVALAMDREVSLEEVLELQLGSVIELAPVDPVGDRNEEEAEPRTLEVELRSGGITLGSGTIVVIEAAAESGAAIQDAANQGTGPTGASETDSRTGRRLGVRLDRVDRDGMRQVVRAAGVSPLVDRAR